MVRHRSGVPRQARLAASMLLALALGGCGSLGPVPTEVTTDAIDLVGHDPLFARGMNAGLAVGGNYAYVGYRSDDQESHPHPGILVVDIADPSQPTVVHEFGLLPEGVSGSSSRELRVWAEADLLIVLNIPCDHHLHDCVGYEPSVIRFFDIAGDAAADPQLVAEYVPSYEVHEFFLWEDPEEPGRALLFASTPGGVPHLLITDITGARQQHFEEIGEWFAPLADGGPDPFIHSLAVSPDGTRAYLAYLTAGFLVIDTSEFAAGGTNPAVHPVTDIESRPRWDGPGAHSAVSIPGRDLVLTTDEAYGTYAGSGGGCPWGWTRLVDIADPVHPEVIGEYRVTPYNDPEECGSVPTLRNERSSFSSHNPTVTEHLALITWHSAGLQVVDTSDPADPRQLAAFVPEPLDEVDTEDPALSSGADQVVMWSYPIIRDGLVYVVDVRNGLYILRYAGPHADEIADLAFLEGNSTRSE